MARPSLRRRKRGRPEENGASSTLQLRTFPATNAEKDKIDNDDGWADNGDNYNVLSHPLFRILPLAILAYGLYRLYYYVLLSPPPILQTTLGLRQGVGLGDPRQVLIVGTMSGGTTQVAFDLRSKVGGLEIQHEASDTSWFFARDGTVSWFHAWRMLERPSSLDQQRTSLLALCGINNYTKNFGYHPASYRSTSDCMDFREWSRCWQKECINYLFREWGCARREDDCETPYQITLHQTRHPLRTMASLIVKHCDSDDATLETGRIYAPFWRIVTAMFPNATAKWMSPLSTITTTTRTTTAVDDDEVQPPKPTCVEATAIYVLEYHNAMLEARRNGWIDGMYQLESTTPCEIANMAGFFNESQVVYKPNLFKVQGACRSGQDGTQRMTSTRNKVNRGYLDELSMDDLLGGKYGSKRAIGDDRLQVAMKKLLDDLGYNEE